MMTVEEALEWLRVPYGNWVPPAHAPSRDERMAAARQVLKEAPDHTHPDKAAHESGALKFPDLREDFISMDKATAARYIDRALEG